MENRIRQKGERQDNKRAGRQVILCYSEDKIFQ
jgi:hypothetical protein